MGRALGRLCVRPYRNRQVRGPASSDAKGRVLRIDSGSLRRSSLARYVEGVELHLVIVPAGAGRKSSGRQHHTPLRLASR